MRNIMPLSRNELDDFSVVTLLSYPKSINRSKEYHLTYSLALRPSGTLGHLDYGRPFFPIDYLSPSLKLHLS